MARAIVTKEDVKAAGNGGTLEVAPDAVVTEAARELATRTGVTIRTASPGAPLLAPSQPANLGTKPAEANRCLLTAVGRNRPGILAELTACLADLNGSVNEISQQIVGDYFSTILMVDLSDVESFGSFKQQVESLGREGDYKVVVQHERIFRAMHRL